MLPVSLAVALILATAVPGFAQGTAAGTAIENSATLNYQNEAGQDQPAVTSDTVTVTVTQVAGVTSAPTTAASAAAGGSTVYYALTITNTGNGTDTFDLSVASSHNPVWTVTLIKDDGAGGGTPNDGVHQAGETNTASDTGVLAGEGTFHGFVKVEIPSDAGDGDVDTETLTAASQFDGGRTATLVSTTTAESAVFSIGKAADPSTPAPGDTITYTITYQNSGSANATAVVITDTLPDEVDYVADSVTLNGAAKTDAADTDEVTVSGGTVTVSLGTVAVSAQGTITFRVTVK